jgi:hypothetical protein
VRSDPSRTTVADCPTHDSFIGMDEIVALKSLTGTIQLKKK